MFNPAKRLALVSCLTVSFFATHSVAQNVAPVDPCLDTEGVSEGTQTNLECIQLPDPALAGATNFVPTLVLGGVAAVATLLATSNGPGSTSSTP